jgi:hypothetical protein
MSGLLVPYGFPTTQAGGTEGLGKNVDTATLNTVAPNGKVETPAALQTDINTTLTNGGQNVFALWRPSLNASPNI